VVLDPDIVETRADKQLAKLGGVAKPQVRMPGRDVGRRRYADFRDRLAEQPLNALPVRQIGRASCRERV